MDSYSKPKRSGNELGRFTDFNPLGERYLETKRRSLHSALHEDEKKESNKIAEIWKQIIKNVDEYKAPFKFNQRMKCEMLKIHPKTYQRYMKIVADEGDVSDKVEESKHNINPYLKDDNVIVKGEQDIEVAENSTETPL